ncbi:Endoplasmic reticulum oxidoreductin-1 [Capsicum chinense]|nr:Endoplasmic reticulum oxidoreductin-1 [Capsicum chinense]
MATSLQFLLLWLALWSEMAYVNLLLNLERYTDASGEICQEKKVLYKLISGLHSSISIHIAADYLLDKTTNLWGTNPDLMYGRVLQYLEHVKYYLERAEYDTGNPEEDLKA